MGDFRFLGRFVTNKGVEVRAPIRGGQPQLPAALGAQALDAIDWNSVAGSTKTQA